MIMKKINSKDVFNDAKIGGLIGIGISLTFTIATSGFSSNPFHWIGMIVFGFLVGIFMSVGNHFAVCLFIKIFPKYNQLILLLLVIVYVVSTAIFYGFTSLFAFIFRIFSSKADLLYVSLGQGIACVMVTLFFIYAHEKEEMFRLEQENRKLAVVDERNRIAREFHDSVSQNLFGIRLNLNTLDLILEQEPLKAREITKLLQGMVEEVQNEMRLMIYELRPIALSEQGFFEALENLVILFRVRYNLDIQSNLHGDEGVDSQKQLVLYRVLQESLNNIVKYAGATKVKVVLKLQNNSGELLIQDNGKGFVISEKNEDIHLGLKGMKERVEEMKGQFIIESLLGKGTMVRVRF
jgi:two-component system, NarL family, sensor histidine kinase LiaS